jgi:glycosyltransferase involved in cell wall biosynthesis
MKIAWFTPFCVDSAIGKCSVIICEEMLKRGISIDIYAETEHGKNPHKTAVNVVYCNSDDLDVEELKKYDYVVYNLGNNCLFHRGVYLAMKKFPGIALLHDQTMADFLFGFFEPTRAEKNIPESLWREEYDLFFSSFDDYDRLSPPEFLDKYFGGGHNMLTTVASFRPFLANSKAVFTHAAYFKERIFENYNLPTEFAYLSCVASEENSGYASDSDIDKDSEKIRKIISQAKKENRKIIVSTGIVSPTKRNDKLVNAIAEEKELQNSVCLIMIGEYNGEFGDNLKNLSRGKLSSCFHLTGRLSYAAMFEALKNADLCVNLRHPNTEVISLSLFEQMYYGKPVLTLNSGIYAEIPEGCTLRVNIENEKPEIKTTLYKLVSAEKKDIEQMEKIGKNAENWVKENCVPEKYVDKLLGFLEKVNKEYEVYKLKAAFLNSLKARADSLFADVNEMPDVLSNVADKIVYFLGDSSAQHGAIQ